MEEVLNRDLAYLMLKIISNLINGEATPESIQGLSLEERDNLIRFAKKHSLSAVTAAALQYAGFNDPGLLQIYSQAARRSVLFDHEYGILSRELTNHQIPYLPIKGILLKSIYPKSWMREMSDIDILTPNADTQQVKSIMEAHGYSVHLFGRTNHDVYKKPPFFIIEMHNDLFNERHYPQFNRYFRGIERLTDDGCHQRMNLTDCYAYLIAHLYVHYASSGVGLRALLDICLLRRKYSAEISDSPLAHALDALGLTEFEKEVSRLADKLLEPDSMTQDEKEALDYYIFSATFGNRRQFLYNRIDKYIKSDHTKAGYLRSRFKLSQPAIEAHPFYSKHPRLVPLMWVTRPVKALFTKPKAIVKELKILKRYSGDQKSGKNKSGTE